MPGHAVDGLQRYLSLSGRGPRLGSTGVVSLLECRWRGRDFQLRGPDEYVWKVGIGQPHLRKIPHEVGSTKNAHHRAPEYKALVDEFHKAAIGTARTTKPLNDMLSGSTNSTGSLPRRETSTSGSLREMDDEHDPK